MHRRFLFIVLIAVASWGCNLRDDGTGTTPDAGGDASTCTAEQSATCDGACVDTNANVDHCGACANSCFDHPDNTDCVEPICSDGACSFEPLAGDACTLEDETSGVCVAGECVECTQDAECVDLPTSHEQCWAATCTDQNECDYDVPDPDVPCGSATCEDGVFREPDLCGDRGSCNLRDPGTDCAPYVCDDADDACRDACSEASDCAEGFTCFDSQCLDALPVSIVIDADAQNVVVSDALVDQYGWDGSLPVNGTITVAADAAVGSATTSDPALLIDALPAESELTIVNSGMILGAGGKGGDALANASGYPEGYNEPTDGGPALEIRPQSSETTLQVDNRGVIGGGGGGGAAGMSYHYQYDISLGVGGGGGAGYAVGPAGQADDSFTFSGDGQDGTRTSGGEEGRYEGVGGGRGGNLGRRGGRVDDAQDSSTRGDGGPAVVGESYFMWISWGNIEGQVLP